jgi:hypothetical protein
VSIAVASLVATLILLGTAAADEFFATDAVDEVFVTDAILTDVEPPPVDKAYSPENVADSFCDAADDCGCDAADGCGCDAADGCCCPAWTFTAGSLIMDRSTPDDAVLVTDSFGEWGNVLLDANEFAFNFRAGWEFSAIRHNLRCTCWDLEARYARIDGWRAVRDPVFSPYGSVVRYATPLGNPYFPAMVSAGYESHFDSLELNLRRPTGCGWLTLLGGFRFAELDERGMTIFRVTDPESAQPNVVSSEVGAINDLYGFQLGADARLWQWCCLSVDGKLRAGVYYNRAVGSVVHSQSSVDQAWAVRDRDSQTAFLGELGLTGTCQLTDALAVTAGYQVMWLAGVAVASDQLAVSDPYFGTSTVDTSGSPFYHGAVISLEYNL